MVDGAALVDVVVVTGPFLLGAAFRELRAPDFPRVPVAALVALEGAAASCCHDATADETLLAPIVFFVFCALGFAVDGETGSCHRGLGEETTASSVGALPDTDGEFTLFTEVVVVGATSFCFLSSIRAAFGTFSSAAVKDLVGVAIFAALDCDAGTESTLGESLLEGVALNFTQRWTGEPAAGGVTDPTPWASPAVAIDVMVGIVGWASEAGGDFDAGDIDVGVATGTDIVPTADESPVATLVGDAVLVGETLAGTAAVWVSLPVGFAWYLSIIFETEASFGDGRGCGSRETERKCEGSINKGRLDRSEVEQSL